VIKTHISETISEGTARVSVLPEAQIEKGELIVIKLGGSTLKNETNIRSLLTEVVVLHETGARVVLVHGGGPHISEALAASGEQAHFVEGLRVTDDRVLAVARDVLDDLNETLVMQLQVLGVPAVSFNSKSSSLLLAQKKLIACGSGARLDIGFVGEIKSVDVGALANMLDHSLPVFASMTCDECGQLYNVNADNVAMALAVALGADTLVYLTEVPGILIDKDVVLPRISIDEVGLLIESGIIRDGMIPKVRNCATGIKKGVGSIIIGKADQEGALLSAILNPGSTGTVIVDDALAA
jgi:acetylglutamate kinase